MITTKSDELETESKSIKVDHRDDDIEDEKKNNFISGELKSQSYSIEALHHIDCMIGDEKKINSTISEKLETQSESIKVNCGDYDSIEHEKKNNDVIFGELNSLSESVEEHHIDCFLGDEKKINVSKSDELEIQSKSIKVDSFGDYDNIEDVKKTSDVISSELKPHSYSATEHHNDCVIVNEKKEKDKACDKSKKQSNSITPYHEDIIVEGNNNNVVISDKLETQSYPPKEDYNKSDDYVAADETMEDNVISCIIETESCTVKQNINTYNDVDVDEGKKENKFSTGEEILTSEIPDCFIEDVKKMITTKSDELETESKSIKVDHKDDDIEDEKKNNFISVELKSQSYSIEALHHIDCIIGDEKKINSTIREKLETQSESIKVICIDYDSIEHEKKNNDVIFGELKSHSYSVTEPLNDGIILNEKKNNDVIF